MLALALCALMLGFVPLEPFSFLGIGVWGCHDWVGLASCCDVGAAGCHGGGVPSFCVLCACSGMAADSSVSRIFAALLERGDSIVIAPAPLRLTLALDDVGAMLLGGASLLWAAAASTRPSSCAERLENGKFAIWWLLTLTGSLGVFIVADMTSFYLVFSLASLAA